MHFIQATVSTKLSPHFPHTHPLSLSLSVPFSIALAVYLFDVSVKYVLYLYEDV